MNQRKVLFLFDEINDKRKDLKALAECCHNEVKTLSDLRQAIRANEIDAVKMYNVLISQPQQTKVVKKTTKQEKKSND